MNTQKAVSINLKQVKRIHFVGIKGVAMSALAILAKEQGIAVTGSDVSEEFPTDTILKRFHITPFVGFKTEHLKHNPDIVIYTGAHNGRKNIEVVAAQKKHIHTFSHGEALGMFMQEKKGISVAGAHGKTTTSAMIATILAKGECDPSFAVGCGEIFALKTPAHYGSGAYFVAEADEYITDPSDPTPRFLWQHPYVGVITNIDLDHVDVFSSIEQIKKAFVQFTQNIVNGGFLVCGADNTHVRTILSQVDCPVVTYGLQGNADINAKHITFAKGKTTFRVFVQKKLFGEFTLPVPGLHNVQNALAAISALYKLSIPVETIKKGLAQFTGTKRRFELVGKRNDVWFYDDYAHHPAEIAATLSAMQLSFPKQRIITIFQAHTYSRTKGLLQEFSQCFSDASIVLITDIYASAREKKDPDISGSQLAQAIKQYHSDVEYTPDKEAVIQYLEHIIAPNDVVITMGAGDVYQWLPDIMQELS